MDCIVNNRLNGEQSRLYDNLLSSIKNEIDAKDIYASVYTEEFFEMFGDFVNNSENMLDRLDENGEPKLFLNKRLNKTFVLDSNNQQVFFPYKQDGLRKAFSSNEIKEFSQSLAHTFYEENITISPTTGEPLVIAGVTIRDHVIDLINRKIAELGLSDDFDEMTLSMALEDSLDNVDEWVENVRAFFKSVKLDNRLEEHEEFIENEESANDEIMRKESFLKSSKDSISNNVKLYLSLIPSVKKNQFGDNTFVGFDEIYTVLNNALRDITPTYDEQGIMEDEFLLYLEEIRKLIPFKPYLQKIYSDLTAANYSENQKNQFTQAFRLVKNNFLGSELNVVTDSKGNKTISYSVKNLSEVSSRKSNLIQQWKFNFEVLGNMKSMKKHGHIAALNRDKYTARSINPSDRDTEDSIKELTTLLKKLGVYGTEEGLQRYLYEGKLDKPSNEDLIQKVISTFDGIAREMENAMEDEAANLFENQSIFKELAEAEAFFIEEGSDATIFSVGKTKWVYSRASFLSQQINKWKRNPELLIKQYESNPHTKSSLWMKHLTAAEYAHDYAKRVEVSKERLSKVAVNIFNSVQTKGEATDAVDNKSITDTDALNDYIHKLMGARYNNGKTYHKTALAADKSTEYQLFFGNDPSFYNLYTNAFVEGGKIKVSAPIVDIFFDYFNGEYKRMAYEHQFVSLEGNKSKLKQNYHLGNKNAFKSQLFPSLSIRFAKDGSVIQPDIDLDLYDDNGVPVYQDLNDVKAKITQIIQDSLSDIIHKTHDTLIEKQLVKFDSKGNMYNNAFDSALFQNMQQEGSVESAIVKLAADVSINSLISQIEYSKMFTGDTAYYKNLDDYLKRVPATYTDGQYGRFQPGEENFNVAVIAGVVVSPDSLAAMREYLSPEIVDKYVNSVNSTDGQAWISPERWRSVMKALGKPEYLVDKIYKKMYDGGAFTENEKKLLSTVLKGVHYELTEDGVPVFLKYSQAVIIPAMVKGTGLEKLLTKMKSTKGPNGNAIDELITIDGMKVGSFKPEKTHDENGNVLDDFTLQPFALRNEFWKLQQDLPVKGSKQTDVGSQVQQIVFAALAHNAENKRFELEDGTVLDGNEMKHYLNDVFGAMTYNGMNGVIKDLGLDFSDPNQPFKFKDEEKVFNMIIDQMSSRKDVTSNFMTALESHTSPYGIPGAKEMFHNVFNAYMTDRIVKIKTNGGGFIQMSDYGLSYDEATKASSGIKLAPWFKDSKLHTPKVVGISPATGKKVIQPGGCFISASIISKYVPDWNDYTSEELFGTLNEDTGKYEDGLIDAEILQNIISYRIPTQGLGSADAFIVMGILPDASSDTIIPYTGITTKTGSDFDIDKMYLMIPSFKPSYNVDTAKVYDFIREEIHKDNVHNSILYIQDLLKELDVSTDDLANKGFDINEFYKKTENRNYISKTISQSDRALVNALIGESNREHPLVKKMYDKYKIKTTSLNYISPDHNVRGEGMMSHMPIEMLQNKLISSYKSIFTNEDVINEVMNPIDFPFVSDDVKNINGVVKPKNLEAFDGISQVKVKSNFMKGKAGLGQNVNSLVDSIRGSMADLFLINKAIGQGHMRKNNGILETVFDKEYSGELSDAELEFYVKDFNEKRDKETVDPITLEDVKQYQKIKLNESMTALINAFVDIVKDSYIVDGNWTTITNNIGFLLLRAGVHPYVVTSFIAQPVLKNYVNFVTNMESNVIDKTNKIMQEFKLKFAYDNMDDAKEFSLDTHEGEKRINAKDLFRRLFSLENIEYFDEPGAPGYEKGKTKFQNVDLPRKLAEAFDVVEEVEHTDRHGKTKIKKIVSSEHKDALEKMSFELMDVFENTFEAKQELDFKDVSLIDLRSQISEPTPEFQSAILKIFIDFQELAKNLTKNVKASKISVDGPGKNISSLVISSNIINELLDNTDDGTLGGFESKLINRLENEDGQVEEKPTMLKHVLDNAINFTYSVMRANPKFFLTADDSVVSTFNKVSNMLYGNSLQSEKLAEKLDRGFYSYIMSGFKPLQMDNTKKRDLLKDMPDRFKFMERKYPKNALLSKMYTREGEVMKLAHTQEEFKNKEFYQKSYLSMPNLKTSVSSQNDIVDGWTDLFINEPAFAEDLVKYSYLTTGFNNNINAFFQKIPAEWFNKNKFNSYLINTRNRQEGIYDDFIDQFFRNNYYDASLCRRTFLKFMEPKHEGQFNNGIKGISSTIAFRHKTNKGYMLYTVDEDARKLYYKLIGQDPNGHFIYVRTSVLGNRDNRANKIVEYSLGDTFAESTLSTNRITMSEDSFDKWTNIYLDENVTRVVTASNNPGGFRTRSNANLSTLLQNSLTLNGGETVTENASPSDYDANHFYTEYTGFKDLLMAARVKQTPSGEDLYIDGKPHKIMKDSNGKVEVRQEGDQDLLLMYTTDAKEFGVLVGTRDHVDPNELDSERLNFTTLPEFFHNLNAPVKIQEAQPSVLDSDTKQKLINDLKASFSDPLSAKIFEEAGIGEESDLENLPDDKISDLIEKICM